MASTFHSLKRFGVLAISAAALIFGGCPQNPPADQNTDPNDPGDNPANTAKPMVWTQVFDAAKVGALSAVWGSGDSDVFVVGGKGSVGEVYHWNGSEWAGMAVPPTPILVWVYGFGPKDVWAVGVGGGVLHYDGTAWKKLDAGTTNDLWGVWGRASNDLWIVGGRVGGDEAILIHYDGSKFTRLALPANDRNAHALFKVWGIGSKVFAVGESGLIIQYEGDAWKQVPAGAEADEDFVSLWGTSENNIVAVGGRSSARIAHYDGSAWTTRKFAEIPGLNGVYMPDENTAVVCGARGFAGTFNPSTGELLSETVATEEALHAIWGDSTGRVYGVGGRFADPYFGVAFVRTAGDPGIVLAAPKAAPPFVDDSDDKPDDEPKITDCNGNDVDDADDISSGTSQDCDGNGKPDECQEDTDGDGVANPCDKCPNDASDDSDGDGICDSLDICPGSDDTKDADHDGVPDGCDPCPNDANDDSDGDGVCDSADLCPGNDDRLDADHDGIPNGCDECVGNDLADSDGDGVADACDICPGGDDHADADGDGVPDACDPCPQDAADDSDGDGVCDGADLCPGSDDAIDLDGDGVPDGCDCFETDCEIGFNCNADHVCESVPLDLEVGTEIGGIPYERLREYGNLTLGCGFQGGVDMYLTIRAVGFAPQGAAANLEMDFKVIRLDTGEDIIPSSFFPFPVSVPWNASRGMHEFPNFYMPLSWVTPASINGKQVQIVVSFKDLNDPSQKSVSRVIVTLLPECLQ